MPPLPKRKYAKARQGKRRSHLGVLVPALVPCSQCHNLKPAHEVCHFCGTYNGRQIIKEKAPKKKE